MIQKIIDGTKLIDIMTERDNDKSAHSPNSVDIGYHLAVEHMNEEIDKMKDLSEDVVFKSKIKDLMREIYDKKRKHEYGGFEINRISIDEVIELITKYTGVKLFDNINDDIIGLVFGKYVHRLNDFLAEVKHSSPDCSISSTIPDFNKYAWTIVNNGTGATLLILYDNRNVHYNVTYVNKGGDNIFYHHIFNFDEIKRAIDLTLADLSDNDKISERDALLNKHDILEL